MSIDSQEKQRAVFAGFAIGALSLVPMIIAVVLSNSLTILAAILISASETSANFLSWIALRKASQGKSNEFNYGHGKWENLASLVVAIVMLVSAGVVLYSVVSRLFFEPQQVRKTGVFIGMFISTAAIVINSLLWRKNYMLARQSPSPIMESQWRLFRVKTINSACSLSSYILSVTLWQYAWSYVFDPIFSVLLVCFLGYTAYGVFTSSVYDLLDKTLEETLQLKILKELAVHFDEYSQLHGIHSRRSGSQIYIELYLEFEGDRNMASVQKSIDKIRLSLQGKIHGSKVFIAPVTMPV